MRPERAGVSTTHRGLSSARYFALASQYLAHYPAAVSYVASSSSRVFDRFYTAVVMAVAACSSTDERLATTEASAGGDITASEASSDDAKTPSAGADLSTASQDASAVGDPALCVVSSVANSTTWCPIWVLREGEETPPAVGLDLILQYPAQALTFLGAAVFPCGDPSCAPDFAPPGTLESGHFVLLSPSALASWQGAGSVSFQSTGSLTALTVALAKDSNKVPVVWLGFQRGPDPVPASVTLLSAAVTAPPGAELTAETNAEIGGEIIAGVVLVRGKWLSAPPACITGTSIGACDDGLACTVDRCNAGGVCEHTLAAGSCAIGGTCWAAGVTNPANPCEICEPAQFEDAWSSRQGEACDDGDACTAKTVCIKASCQGEPVLCNDKNPCTTDSCDPIVGCRFELEPTCGDELCDQDPTAPECQCVVARARNLACGGVLVWGDEHITYSSYEETEPFWQQTLTWLAASGECGLERLTVSFQYGSTPAMLAAAAAVGLTVVNDYGVPSSSDIVVTSAGGAYDPVAVKTWVEAGGVVMFTTVGFGSGSSECEAPNEYLTPLGYTLDCAVAPPWGPVVTPGTHPIMEQLTEENAPFVNGRWVNAGPGVPKGVVARVLESECPPP